MFDPRYLAGSELYLIRSGGRWNVALHQGEITSVSCANNSETVSRSQTSPYASAARVRVQLTYLQWRRRRRRRRHRSLYRRHLAREIHSVLVLQLQTSSPHMTSYRIVSHTFVLFHNMRRTYTIASGCTFKKPPKIDTVDFDWNTRGVSKFDVHQLRNSREKCLVFSGKVRASLARTSCSFRI